MWDHVAQTVPDESVGTRFGIQPTPATFVAGVNEKAIDLVAPHCDIVERLAAVPAGTLIRGIWFRSIEDELGRRGLARPYAGAFAERDEAIFKLYPVTDYLVRLAFAGALVASPQHVHDGMFEISRGNAVFFSKSLLGRGMAHLIGRKPERMARQSVASKQHTTNYGRWSVGDHGPDHVEIVLEDEYIWIESAMLGAASGTFEASGGRCEARLRDRFNGSILITF